MSDTQQRAADGSLEELSRQPPLRERARDQLERLIVSGVYQPGEHLVETDLAKRLGVSRGPVREALYMLELQGWVDLRPRQGAFVHSPSFEEIGHFFDVRILLESQVSVLVAGNIAGVHLDHLRGQIAEAREAIKRKDGAGLIAANATFHGYVHRLSGNPALVELVETLDKRMRWYFSPVAMERAADAWDEHEALVDAFAARDAELAAEMSRQHSEATRTAYLRHRESLDAAGRVSPST